jgi:hypothetical protein
LLLKSWSIRCPLCTCAHHGNGINRYHTVLIATPYHMMSGKRYSLILLSPILSPLLYNKNRKFDGTPTWVFVLAGTGSLFLNTKMTIT